MSQWTGQLPGKMALILKLPESTIQMIAAGEVITRPANVIKELLENSLDAGATNIRILIENGGAKSMEIIDNGHGIARANAELLCQRYATSKLTSADDLTRISTFGFRGEALASVSEMAEVEVKTLNMKSDRIGWQAKYLSGKLVQPPVEKYIQSPGTLIRVSNLFSNLFLRKSAMNSADDKKSIVDLVSRYAIHHRDRVTMTLKENMGTDLICLIAPMETPSCIGMFFGMEFENNIVELEVENQELFEMKGKIVFSYKKSSGNFQQTSFILFVNDRLVECNAIKKEVEAVAAEYLTLKQYVFLFYISLFVPPHDVDVNMHPAKETVALHHQDDIIVLIVNALKTKLKENHNLQATIPVSTQRTIADLKVFLASPKTAPSQQLQLTKQAEERLRIMAPACLDQTDAAQKQVATSSAKRPHDLIHNDFSQQSLEQTIVPPRRPRRDLKLRSIYELRQLVLKEKSRESAKIIKSSTFVGIFDHDRALIQYETKLYAIHMKAYLKELYYQFYLFDFGNFPPIEILPPGNKIKFILTTYLDDLRQYEHSKFEALRLKTANSVIERLLAKRLMFEDYLSLKLTEDEILTLPCIMPDEAPNLVFLGEFLVNLANIVDFTDEKSSLNKIGRLIADFYSEPPANLKDEEVHRRYHELVESKLYVAIKNYLQVPEWLFSRENICQISDTKDLYKVFERC